MEECKHIYKETKQTPLPQSASELYRPSDRRLSTKLVPTFADRGYRMVSSTDPYDRILDFLNRSKHISTILDLDMEMSVHFKACAVYPRETVSITHWTGVLVRHRAFMDRTKERNISISIPRSSSS
jgi:hypothetical protein